MSPLTNSPCIWYRARVERFDRERENDRNSSIRWRTERERASTVPFLLSDGSGACLIDPSSKDITPHDESIWYGNSHVPKDRDPPKLPPHSSGLTPHYADNVTQQFRYKEERIYQGNTLFIIGEMRDAPPPAPEYDEEENLDEDEESNHELDESLSATKPGRSDRSSDDEGADALDELFDRFEEEDRENFLKAGRKRANRMLVKVRLLSAQPPEEMLKMLTTGSKAFFCLGLVGLSIVGILLWFRLGS